MCGSKESKSDYIYMMNSSPEYESWLRNRFETANDLFLNLNNVEFKRYKESQLLAMKYEKYEEFIDDANKNIKIYKFLSNISEEESMKNKFIRALEKVQEYDKKGYAYDEDLLRKYSYTYYKEMDLREDIIDKLERASKGEVPPMYKLSIFDKCYKSYDNFETSAKLLATRDTSELNKFDVEGITKKDFEGKLKVIRALSILNDEYLSDIKNTDVKIKEIEDEIGHSLFDYSKIITREIKYIKNSIVDMMSLSEKIRHSFSVDGEIDIEFDL